MDKKKHSILKQDVRIPLQETVSPDFLDDDTSTVTVTKSRRVSFGANFVKEFIIGSAVSTQFYSEYEQAVSSSDSSNTNSSRSGVFDQSQGNDILDLSVSKSAINNENELICKKRFSEKCKRTWNEKCGNNDENWEFDVENNSNIFLEKKSNSSNADKSEFNTSKAKCSKMPFNSESFSATEKMLQNKRIDSDVSQLKGKDMADQKSKQGKFSSTICFSADSPTADMEFTEGCITLAKSIFDKKKMEMTVYIQPKPKDSNETIHFEASGVEMSLTKCVDGNLEACADTDEEDLPKPFELPSSVDMETDESTEDIVNILPGSCALNGMLGLVESEEDEANLERSLFFPDRTLTEMLYSGPLKMAESENSDGVDEDGECDMDITAMDIPCIVTANFSRDNSSRLVNGAVEINRHQAAEINPGIKKCTDSSHYVREESFHCQLTEAIYCDAEKSSDSSSIIKENSGRNPFERGVNVEVCKSNDFSRNITESVEIDTLAKEEVNTENLETCSDSSDSSVLCNEGEEIKPQKIEERSVEKFVEKIEKLNDSPRITLENKEISVLPGKDVQYEGGMSDDSSSHTINKNEVDHFPRERIPDIENFNVSSRSIRGDEEINTIKPEGIHSSVEITDSSRVINGDEEIEPLLTGEMILEETSHDSPFFAGRNEEIDHPPEGTASEKAINTTYLKDCEMHASPADDIMSVTEKTDDFSLVIGGDEEMNPQLLEEKMPEGEKSEGVPCNIEDHNETNSLQEEDINYEEENCKMQNSESRGHDQSLEESFDPEDMIVTETPNIIFNTEPSNSTSYPSQGDRKIFDLLYEQSRETNCCWKIVNFVYEDGNSFWSFSFPLLDSLAVIRLELKMPRDDTVLSFSLIIDRSIRLQETEKYQPMKSKITTDFAFEKLKNWFHQENWSLETVHKVPIFLDLMNLFALKVNEFVTHLLKILNEYPGSRLHGSVLSFRVYSFALLFSLIVKVDLDDPFHLSENSISVEKHFGYFNENRIKLIFAELPRSDDILVQFIRTLTKSVIDREREIGLVTNRSHIRLLT